MVLYILFQRGAEFGIDSAVGQKLKTYCLVFLGERKGWLGTVPFF